MTLPDQNELSESVCRNCGGHNPVWFAPNELWNRVIEDKALIICPVCFIKLAEEKGIRPTGWLLQEESRTVQAEILAALQNAYDLAMLNVDVHRFHEGDDEYAAQQEVIRAFKAQLEGSK